MTEFKDKIQELRKIVRDEVKIKYPAVVIYFRDTDHPPVVNGRTATKYRASTRYIEVGAYWGKLREHTIGNLELVKALMRHPEG